MKPEELLKPRYKVIADYPDSKFTIGNIIDASSVKDMDMWLKVMGKKWVNGKLSMFAKYPHIFKPLSWWEDRAKSDMPEYVKCKITCQCVEPIYKENYFYKLSEIKDYSCLIWFLPATEEQYNECLKNNSK